MQISVQLESYKKGVRMNFFPVRRILNDTIALPADIKYHGLFNQGATCYLNSVLQVLFMTKDFREAVERSICENPDTEFIDRNLKELFEDVKKKTASTCNITKKLGINRVYEQKDAAEYYEKILALTSPDASQIFHGQLTHKTVCSECGTEKNTDGSFWHLPLELVDSYGKIYSVVDGTEEYFRDSHFSGENQMYCDKCDAKSNATIKCALKHYPEVLMLLLKRFEFNYSYMTYVKNNCDVDVPYTLQITESQTYELYAVVDHNGDLRSGHYTANIKSQDNERWYNFNDTRVTLLDYQPFQVDNTECFHSAYLLFYRRKKTHAAVSCTQDIKEVSTSGGTSGNSNQCQDAETLKEQEAVSIEINGKTGIDVRESQQYNHQECNEERGDLHDQDTHTEKRERNKRKIDEMEEKEANTGIDEQSTEGTHAQPEKSVEYQDYYHGGQDNVRLNRPQESFKDKVTHNTSYVEQRCEQEVSNMHVRHDCMDMLVNEEKIVTYENINKNSKTEGDEQSDKLEEIPKYLNREAKIQDNEGLDIVKHIDADKRDKQEVREESGLQPVSVDEKGDEGKMEIDVQDDMGGKTEADKLRSDHYDHEFQNQERVGNSEQNVSKDDGWCKQGADSSGLYKRDQQQREERGDVKGDKEQKRGGKMEEQQHCGQDVEGEIHRVDVRLNTPEQISVRHKHFNTEKPVKVSENTEDTHHIHTRPDSSFRQPGLAGKERLTETQRVDSKERTRLRNSQSKDTMKGVKESERNSEIITVAEISQDTTKRKKKRRKNRRESAERKSDSKSDGRVILIKGSDRTVSDAPEPQKHRTRISVNAKEDSDKDIVLLTNEGKMSDAQIHGGRRGMRNKRKHKLRNPLTRIFKLRQKKKKGKKTIGCFSVFNKKQRKEDQNSDSE